MSERTTLGGRLVAASELQGRSKEAKLDKPWWTVAGKDRGKAVKLTLDRWWEQHAPRRQEYQTLIEQYEAATVGALTPQDYAPEGRRSANFRYNVVRSVIDTLTSRYSKEKPRPVFMTEKGRWRHKRHAKELNKMVYGILQQNNVYKVGRQLFREAALLQMGILKTSVNPQTYDIEIERTYPGEWVWDLADAFRGCPTEMGHIVPRPRAIVLAKYPEHAKALRDVPRGRDSEQSQFGTSDLVDVQEIWKLPSYRGAKDGRHSIVIHDVMVLDEEWEFDRFPHSITRFSAAFRGYAGCGLGSVLLGFQLALNKHLLSDEAAVERGSKLRCFVVGDGAELQISKLETDVDGGIYHIKNAQSQPIFDPGRSLDPQKVEYNRWIMQSAYEASGISQGSAAGSKPAGIEAAAAMRELQDIESLRFMEQQSEYEEMFIDLAKVILMFARKYWTDRGKVVHVRGRGFIESINFDDIKLPEDEFEIGVYAASMLPKQPGARRQALQEMVDARILSIPQMMLLMEMPDIDSEAELRAAPLSDIDATIAHFLEDDPDPAQLASPKVKARMAEIRQLPADERDAEREQLYADLLYQEPIGVEALQEGIVRMQNAYLIAKHSDVNPARLNLLLNWASDAERLLASSAMAGQANAIGAGPSGTPGIPGMPGAPGAMPQPQPQPGAMPPQGSVA